MDDILQQLRMGSLPPELEALDDRVLDGLATRRREANLSRRIMALAAVISLGGGMLAGSMIVRPASAAAPLTPLIPATPFAPSTILDAR